MPKYQIRNDLPGIARFFTLKPNGSCQVVLRVILTNHEEYGT